MTDVATIAGGAALAAGLSIFGVQTGIDPAVLLAGLGGGLWAQFSVEVTVWWKRVISSSMSAIVAAMFTPIGFGFLRGVTPELVTDIQLSLAIATVIGFLTFSVISPMMLKLAQKKAEELTK